MTQFEEATLDISFPSAGFVLVSVWIKLCTSPTVSTKHPATEGFLPTVQVKTLPSSRKALRCDDGDGIAAWEVEESTTAFGVWIDIALALSDGTV